MFCYFLSFAKMPANARLIVSQQNGYMFSLVYFSWIYFLFMFRCLLLKKKKSHAREHFKFKIHFVLDADFVVVSAWTHYLQSCGIHAGIIIVLFEAAAIIINSILFLPVWFVSCLVFASPSVCCVAQKRQDLAECLQTPAKC